MPFNATTIIAIVALLLGIATWWRTRRVGPVLTIVLGAFVLMAVTDTSFLTSGGNLVKKALTWVSGQITV